MSNEKDEKKAAADQNKDAAIKPDPETLHTTDPQENMEGPISSLVQGVKEDFEENATKDEEDEEKKK